jgi:hypothetical protein
MKVPGGPAALVSRATAAGFWTVATEGEGVFDGSRESSIVVRGWRGQDRFVAVYLLKHDSEAQGGPKWAAHRCYWWQREQSAVIPGFEPRRVWSKVNSYSEQQTTRMVRDDELDEHVTFLAPEPVPTRCTVTELKSRLTALAP